jgi:DNA-binding beta-propeller fold protein YncE
MSGQANWKIVNTFHVGGEGSWDYVTMDPSHRRLFVTRGTHTQAIDEVTGAVLGDIPGQIHSHGVALVPSLGRGFITDGGGAGTIIVFDLKSYAVLGKIPAVPDADGIIYEKKVNRLLVVSGDAKELLTFSPDIPLVNGKLDPPIALGGAPEFFASDGSGKVYVNLEDKNLVAVVDLNTRKVIARWPIAPGGHPYAMAIDSVGRHLFVGCRNPQMLVVMNADSGAIEASLPIGGRVDATRFDAGEAFASAGDGALAVAGQKDGKWIILETVTTPEGARTMGLDPSTQKIYLPTAEFEPATTDRPKPKPGTFMIVEVGR